MEYINSNPIKLKDVIDYLNGLSNSKFKMREFFKQFFAHPKLNLADIVDKLDGDLEVGYSNDDSRHRYDILCELAEQLVSNEHPDIDRIRKFARCKIHHKSWSRSGNYYFGSPSTKIAEWFLNPEKNTNIDMEILNYFAFDQSYYEHRKWSAQLFVNPTVFPNPDLALIKKMAVDDNSKVRKIIAEWLVNPEINSNPDSKLLYLFSTDDDSEIRKVIANWLINPEINSNPNPKLLYLFSTDNSDQIKKLVADYQPIMEQKKVTQEEKEQKAPEELNQKKHEELIQSYKKRVNDVIELLESGSYDEAISGLEAIKIDAEPQKLIEIVDLAEKYIERAQLFKKLKEMFKVSKKLNINDITDQVNRNRKEMMDLFFKWADNLGVVIEGEYITINNTANLDSMIFNLLDKSFEDWAGKEKTNQGKIN